MKRFIHKNFLIFFLIFVIIILASPVYGQSLRNPLRADTFAELLHGLADILIKIGIPLVGIFIVYSGFLFVTAGGDEKKLETAKTTFYWTIIGGVIILGSSALAIAIVDLVRNL